MSLHENRLEHRFNEARLLIEDNQDVLLLHFASEVLHGLISSDDMSHRIFDQFSSIFGVERIQWPPFYIGCACKLFTTIEPALAIGKLLCQVLPTYAAAEESGKDWEVIVTVATLFHCLESMLSGVKGPFGIVDANVKPSVVYETVLDQSLEDLRKTLTEWYSKCSSPTLLVVDLAFSRFPGIDLAVCYGDKDGHVVDGYQMKLTRAYPKKPLPDWIRKGFLFRGSAPAVGNRKKNWHYLAAEDVTNFLGTSMSHLTPERWGSIPDEDKFHTW
jgi:hypothetical protein